MTIAQIAVTGAGLAAIAGIVWFFWLKKEEGVQASLTSSGYQEATVLVKGGYTPSAIRVQHGTPVRLTFHREESAPCSRSVSATATEYGRRHGVTVIDGGCPLMFGPTADTGHKIMRVFATRTGKVPRRV